MTHEELMGTCMQLISNAGEGRALLSEALTALVKRDVRLAEEKLALAESFLSDAHKIQFEGLMGPQQRGEVIPFDLLMIHAMDILMVAGSEKDTLRAVIAGLSEEFSESESGG